MRNSDKSASLLTLPDGIEDICALSPAQKSLLFSSTIFSKGDPYFSQITGKIVGHFDENRFESSWNDVIRRHSILRTGFVWQGVKEPLQIIRRNARISFYRASWDTLSEQSFRDKWDSFLKQDRERGCDLRKAPLMRISSIKRTDCHWLVISLHQLIIDGWSQYLLLNQVASSYNGTRESTLINHESAPSYKNYVDWVASSSPVDAEKYWKKETDQLTVGGMLFKRRRVVQQGSYASGDFHVSDLFLSSELTAQLQRIAQHNAVTLNVVMLAAWSAVAQLYGARNDVVIGVAVSTRSPEIPKVDHIVGPLINTVPLRLNIDPIHVRFRDLLKVIHRKQIERNPFEHTGFSQIHAWSGLPATELLSDHVFVFENYPKDETILDQFQGIHFENLSFEERTAFPITVAVFPSESLQVRISCDQEYAEKAEIEDMLNTLLAALQAIVHKSDLSLSQLLLSTPIRGLSNGQITPRSEKSDLFPAAFAKQAKHTPDAIAVVCEDHALSYRELNGRVNRLGSYLRDKGIGPESVVGILLDRSVEMIISILATLKAGGAYLPMDLAMSEERLLFMIKDAKVKILITQKHLLHKIEGHSIPEAIMLEQDWAKISQYSSQNITANVVEENISHILYTSGSTGSPKGVAITHGNLMGFSEGLLEKFDRREPMRISMNGSLSFAIHAQQVPFLLRGHSIHIISENSRRGVREVETFIKENDLEILDTTPGQLSILLDSNIFLPPTVFVTGEPITERLWLRMEKFKQGVSFYNLYGPTEATVDATFFKIAGACSNVIGQPFRGYFLYIVDKHFRNLPAGVEGELLLGGVGVSRGYVNAPSLTAEKFVPNSFECKPNERLYRTGDFATARADGSFRYFGRKDRQVKIRGFRIELFEVEQQLCSHELVEHAHVRCDKTGTDGESSLTAYISGYKCSQEEVNDIRVFLLKKLPDYMIPSKIVWVKTFPLNTSGKLDESALLALERKRGEVPHPHRSQPDSIEEVLHDIWKDVLNSDGITKDDNFFDLGGYSLLLARVQMEIETKLGLQISITKLFEHTNIRKLSHYITAIHGGRIASEATPNHQDRLTKLRRGKDIRDQRRRLTMGK